MNDTAGDCGDPIPDLTPVMFRFVYDHNIDGRDRFREEVGHVDLFVFTEDGALYLQREIPVSELDDSNSIALPLPADTYDFVAWGNADSDDYSFILGETREQMALRLNCEADGLVAAHPVHLFHGTASASHTDDGEPTPATVLLIKNSCVVRVVFEGIEPSDGRPWSEDVNVWINASNGMYGFDRELRPSEMLKYVPEYSDGTVTYEAVFAVQRIVEDSDMKLVSINTGYDEPIVTASIPNLISAGYTGDDLADFLDRCDEFTFKLKLEKLPGGGYTLVSIQVNNWDPIEWGDIEI